MEDGLRGYCDDNHDAFESDKLAFLPHHVAAPALHQLGDAVDASNEDAHVSYDDGGGEEAEAHAGQKAGGGGGELVAAAVGADSVFGGEGGEDDEN